MTRKPGEKTLYIMPFQEKEKKIPAQKKLSYKGGHFDACHIHRVGLPAARGALQKDQYFSRHPIHTTSVYQRKIRPRLKGRHLALQSLYLKAYSPLKISGLILICNSL